MDNIEKCRGCESFIDDKDNYFYGLCTKINFRTIAESCCALWKGKNNESITEKESEAKA